MNKEISAVIMAAGKGDRLKEVTGGFIPKTMVEIEGVPVLARTIRSLKAAGVEDVVAVISEDDRYTLPALNKLGIGLRVVRQNILLWPGTAKAAEYGLAITPNTPERRIIVLNGDDTSLIRPSTFGDLIDRHLERLTDCTVLIIPEILPNDRPPRYLGEADRNLTSLESKAKYGGVLIARYNWLKHFLPLIQTDDGNEFKITRLFQLAMGKSTIDQLILADPNQGNDFNTPQDVIQTRKKRLF